MTNKTTNSLKLNEIINYLSYLTFSLMFAIIGRIWMSYKVLIEEFILNSFFFVFLIVGIIASLAYIDITAPMSERISIKVNEFLLKKKVRKNKLLKEQISKKEIARLQKLEIGINYTKKEFSEYVSKQDLDQLCLNIELYFEKRDLNKIVSIETKTLRTIDIYHFGWNIWNYFKISNQNDLTVFLKKVFPKLLEQVKDDETIKKNLKREELKGIIKIKESLIDDEG